MLVGRVVSKCKFAFTRFVRVVLKGKVMNKKWYKENTTVWQRIGWSIQFYVRVYVVEPVRLEREFGKQNYERNNW